MLLFFTVFIIKLKLDMPKRVIDFYDSVQFSGDWEFAKEKKQRIKVKTQRAVNSEIYVTFNDIVPLYTFLYFALAPQEAFGFQKIQPIFDKMKGDNEQSRQQFEQVRRSLSLNWDGVTPLPDLIRQHKKHIIRQQKNIYNISSRITEQDAKALLRSGLSQRKIHLDYHTNDGQEQQSIIPTVQNINDCITIIHEKNNNKYLLSFFANVQEKKQQQNPVEQKRSDDNEVHNHPQTMKDRPLPNKQIPNPDDRPLPPPPQRYRATQNSTHANQRQPNFQRDILNPDQKLLTPPVDNIPADQTRSKSPKGIINPDDRLLPLPPKVDTKQERKTVQKDNKVASSSTSTGKISEIKAEVKHLEEVAETKIHVLGEKAKDLGRKVEGRVEEVIEDIRNDKYNWVHLGVSALIIGLAIKALRT